MVLFRVSMYQFIYIITLLSTSFLAMREFVLLLVQSRQISGNKAAPDAIRRSNSSLVSLDTSTRQPKQIDWPQVTPVDPELRSSRPLPIYYSEPRTIQTSPRISPGEFILDANTTSFPTHKATTTIVQGIVRQRIIIPGDRHPSFVSFLAARIVGSWESISILAAIGTQNSDTGGCRNWPDDALSKAEMTWECDQGVQHRILLNGSMHGWSRKHIFPAKRGAKPVHQLCYGFIDFRIPTDVEALTLTSAIWQRRVAMRVYHDFSGVAGSYKAINFLLEARSALPRPHISLCLDALFGDVRQAALEFLAFQYAIGVERVFVFDESGDLQLKTALDSLNAIAKDHRISTRNMPLGPFVQRLSLGPGQIALGQSPQADVMKEKLIPINYGARELIMTYCSAETASEIPLEHFSDADSNAEKGAWIFIDIGIDEYLDCQNFDKFNAGKRVSIANVVHQFAHSGARCRTQGCLELCISRYKFGSTILPDFTPKVGSSSEKSESAKDLNSSVQRVQNDGIKPLLLEKYQSSQLIHAQGKCMVQPGPLLDNNFSIEIHGTLRQPRAGKCKINGQPPSLTDPVHCRLGDYFSPTAHSSSGRCSSEKMNSNDKPKVERRADAASRNFPVCRFNHLRPHFFAKCPFQEANCTTYNGQRGVHVAPDKIFSSLGWAAKEIRSLIGSTRQ